MITRYEYDKRSILGKRKNQEDCSDFLLVQKHQSPNSDNDVEDSKILAVLADGMGGHVGGAFASRTLCSKFIEFYKTSDTKETESQKLQSALQFGNNAIAEEIEKDQALNGMGSTLVATVCKDQNLHWVSVGDSLLFIYSNEKLERLNENHSYATMLADQVIAGEITETEAKKHPHRHALISAVTGKSIEKVDLKSLPYKLQKGDWIILASDGLQSLSDEQITKVIKLRQNDGAKAIVDGLLNAVNKLDLPKQDNTTIMAVQSLPNGLDKNISSTAKNIPEQKNFIENFKTEQYEKLVVFAVISLILCILFFAGIIIWNKIPTETASKKSRSKTETLIKQNLKNTNKVILKKPTEQTNGQTPKQ